MNREKRVVFYTPHASPFDKSNQHPHSFIRYLFETATLLMREALQVLDSEGFFALVESSSVFLIN